MAIRRHNLNGIEIVAEDDQPPPLGAVGAANKLMQAEIEFIIPPLFIPSHMAITPITEEAKVLPMKAIGAGRHQANPNLRYSFVRSTFVCNPPVGYDYLKKHYPGVKKITMISLDDPVGKTYREITEKEIRNSPMTSFEWVQT